MEFYFSIKNDRLKPISLPKGVTGNVNTYTCKFDIECKFTDLIWFCVFKQGNKVYNVLIDDNTCLIPYEVLTNPEPLYVGCFGKKADGDVEQVSTNMTYFDLKQGAYEVGDVPVEPPEDAYTLLIKSLKAPYIGKNGNWYEWDVETLSYVDSGVSASGDGESVTDEQIQEAVNNYLEENPVETGATKEQAEQIQANTEGIAQLTEGLENGDIIVSEATKAQEAVDCQNANYASTANVAEFDMNMNRFTEHYAPIKYVDDKIGEIGSQWQTLIDTTLTEEQAGVSQIRIEIPNWEILKTIKRMRLLVEIKANESGIESQTLQVKITDYASSAYVTYYCYHSASCSAEQTIRYSSVSEFFNPDENVRTVVTFLSAPTVQIQANSSGNANRMVNSMAYLHMTSARPPYLNIILAKSGIMASGTRIIMEVCE